MTVLRIRQLGDPALRKRAEPFSGVGCATPQEYVDWVADLVRDLFDTMRAADGLGLAAPQVGVSARVCVLDAQATWGEPVAMVHPRILSASERVVTQEEGCLSVLGVCWHVPRPESVTVEYWTPQWEQRVSEFDALAARVAQHEIDHLDGRLFIDYLSQRDLREALWRAADIGI